MHASSTSLARSLRRSLRSARCCSAPSAPRSFLLSRPPPFTSPRSTLASWVLFYVRCIRRLPVWGCCLPACFHLLDAGDSGVGGVFSPSAITVGGGGPPLHACSLSTSRMSARLSLLTFCAPRSLLHPALCTLAACSYRGRASRARPLFASHALSCPPEAGLLSVGGSRGGRW